MKITKQDILLRLRNWKTIVAIFSLIGLILKTLGYVNFEGQLGNIQDAVYMVGTLLGIWTDHGASSTDTNQQD